MKQSISLVRKRIAKIKEAARTMWEAGFEKLFPYGRSVTLKDGLERGSDNFLLLRILAAAMVIYGHAPAIAPAVSAPDIFVTLGFGVYSGEIAVNIFFLISGFLVTGSFLRHGSMIRFFKLRALRLVPGYVANLLLLAIPVGMFLTILPATEYLRAPEVWIYISKNAHLSSDMAWTLPGVFEGAKTTTINGSQWTLPAEVRMYLLLGLIGAVGLLVPRRTGLLVLVALVATSLFYPHFFPLHAGWFRLAGYFVIGIGAFLCRDIIRINVQLVLAAVILAVITKHLVIYPQMFAFALTAVVFLVAYLLPNSTSRYLERFGDPSYGIYLWGWPSQQLVAHSFPSSSLGAHVSLSLLLAIVLGYLSWHTVEKQALRFK